MDKFGDLQLPVTEYQRDLKQLSTSPIENFMKDFILENYYTQEPIKKYGKEMLALFNDWLKKCKMDYTCNLQSFGLRLKNLKINGISKGNHSNKGECSLYDIQIMKKHFNLDTIDYEEEIEIKDTNVTDEVN